MRAGFEIFVPTATAWFGTHPACPFLQGLTRKMTGTRKNGPIRRCDPLLGVEDQTTKSRRSRKQSLFTECRRALVVDSLPLAVNREELSRKG